MRDAWKTISLSTPVHIVGALTVVAGVSWWSYRLQPSPPAVADVPTHTARSVDAGGAVIAAWLGPGEVRLNIKVVGLARRHDRAVAVLSINDAPPVAYVTGETLMRDVVLQSIESDGITLRRADTTQRIAAPALPTPLASGITRAR
ncbi:MAG: hypothetical protein QM639_11130 [Rhodocyclaceae bacterium]